MYSPEPWTQRLQKPPRHNKYIKVEIAACVCSPWHSTCLQRSESCFLSQVQQSEIRQNQNRYTKCQGCHCSWQIWVFLLDTSLDAQQDKGRSVQLHATARHLPGTETLQDFRQTHQHGQSWGDTSQETLLQCMDSHPFAKPQHQRLHKCRSGIRNRDLHQRMVFVGTIRSLLRIVVPIVHPENLGRSSLIPDFPIFPYLQKFPLAQKGQNHGNPGASCLHNSRRSQWWNPGHSNLWQCSSGAMMHMGPDHLLVYTTLRP